jgi:hypothetical protein
MRGAYWFCTHEGLPLRRCDTMSIFGGLGVARAGFKTPIACMSDRTWSGATILANMGVEPKGINLSLVSLVMVEKDGKDSRHIAETR